MLFDRILAQRKLLGTQQVFTTPFWNDQRKEVRPVLKILTFVIGAVIAIIIAKRFIKDVQNEVAAHDGANIKGDNDNNR